MAITCKIGSRRFQFFNDIQVSLKYAAVGSPFSLKAYFDSQNPEHRELFKPFSYPSVELIDDDFGQILNGTGITTQFEDAAEQKMATLAGYSKTSVLGDCNLPIDQYPLEFNNLNLIEIAEKLCDPFGISVVLGPDTQKAGEVFRQIKIEQGQTIAGFLSKICAQKNLVLTHDVLGNLLIAAVVQTQQSKSLYTEGKTGVLSITANYNGQSMHNEIGVLKQQSVSGSNAAEGTIKNPYVSVYRPVVKNQSSGDDNNTEDALQNALANELKNIKVTIQQEGWGYIDRPSELILPNEILSVVSPENYIFNETQLFIEEVTLNENNEKQTATIQCTLPEAYNGKIPEKSIFE